MLCLGVSQSCVILTPLLNNRVLLIRVCLMLDALLIHYILSIFLKDRFTIELLLFRIIEIRVTLNDYSLLISFSQLVGQLLHLQD